MVKLFLDVTSLFSVAQKIDWAYPWKMSFNPDPSKQAQEVIFSRKCTKEDHPLINFNNIHSPRLLFKNILACILMKNSNYNTQKPSKFYKGIRFLRNLSNNLPRQALVTIYNAFIRRQLDYGDIVYDK